MQKRISIFFVALSMIVGLSLSPQLSGQSASSASSLSAAAQAPGLPDLIADQVLLRRNWVVHVENLPPASCAVIEGGITPGWRTLLRFTVSTPNIGTADLIVGDPNEHVAANDGLFELAECHHHFHFKHYALYELVDPVTGQVWRASKQGFCMTDSQKYQGFDGQANSNATYTECGAPGVPGNQGISVGWADIYVWRLQGQFFVLDGGDGQPPVPPGEYVLRVTVNPGFVPAAGEPCRFADPLHPGVCHQLPESDFENNITQITVTIPAHPGRQGVGPLRNEPPITEEEIE